MKTTLTLLLLFISSAVLAVENKQGERQAETVGQNAINTALSDNDAVDHLPTLSVSITGLSDEALQKNAEAFLAIYEGNGKPVKNASYVDYLAESGDEQIKQALQPFGYYLAKVDRHIDKQPDAWTVTYRVSKGEPVIAERIDVAIDGAGKNQSEYERLVADYPIKVGDVLLQEKYKAFKGDAAALATTYGYFDGDFTRKAINIHDDYQGADIEVTYDTGVRYTFGNTTIKQDFLDQDVFERFILYQTGEPYSSTALADVQRDLYNANYVKMIDVTAEPDKEKKNVPVEFVLTPKKNKKHTFSIGYGTDTGARAKHVFDWRWVNRRGHQFKTKTYVAEKVQELGFEYRIPAQKPATDYYKIFGGAKRNVSGDTESLLWNLGGAYHDQVGNWTREFGLKWQQEDFKLGNDAGNIGLLTPFTTLTYREVDNPLNVSRGFWLQGKLTGAHQAALSDVSFLQAVASAKVIRRFGDSHKGKLYGALGKTWVDDFHQLPADYRFFTGGDRSIRGYKFHDIGDRDTTSSNIGGDKMYYVSAEYEYFFTDNMAAAVFVDAGDAFADDSAAIKVGAGVGFHYYSPIGPIRIDLGHGFHEPGDDIRLHLNIGPEL